MRPEVRTRIRRILPVVVSLVAVAAVVAAVVVSTRAGSSDADTTAASIDGNGDGEDTDDGSDEGSGDGTIETATVERGDLTADSDFRGAVGFGEPWEIPLGEGTVTDSHPIGTLIDFGQSLVTVDAVPVLLVAGDIPMYRDLELRSPRQTGADVAQLQLMLIGAGFDADGRLEADGIFDADTKRAVQDWQEASFREQSGRISQHEIVFSAVPLRLASEPRVGTAFGGVEVTEWEPVVTVDIANRDRSLLPVDAEVTLELDDGTSTAGTVTEQRTVVADDGSTSTRVSIDPADVPGDVTTARVVVTNTVASNELLVPVGALLAVAEGGFALEVIGSSDGATNGGASATSLVAVDVGEILDGRAVVTGDIEAGATVVVAA